MAPRPLDSARTYFTDASLRELPNASAPTAFCLNLGHSGDILLSQLRLEVRNLPEGDDRNRTGVDGFAEGPDGEFRAS